MKHIKGRLIMEKPPQPKTDGQKERFEIELTQQPIIQDKNTGFLFCPRCSTVVIGEKFAGICGHCGYRFCPSCSD
jgi:hypothetical protein